MTTTGPKYVRVSWAGGRFVRSFIGSRMFRRSAFATAFTVFACMSVSPGFSGVRYGLKLRRSRRELTGGCSTFRPSDAANARTRAARTTTPSGRFANGLAPRARASAFEMRGAASTFGLAVKTRAPSRSFSGEAKQRRICFAASAGNSVPTGTPPTVTPSGSGCDDEVVVVVATVVVATVVVAAVVVPIVVVVAAVVVVAKGSAAPPFANVNAASTPAAAQATSIEMLRPFLIVLKPWGCAENSRTPLMIARVLAIASRARRQVSA